MSKLACGKQPVLHLEPCCREAGHDDVCWPWSQLEFPEGVWHITIVNANDDGTAGPLALHCEAIGGPADVQSLCEVVIDKPGYPDSGLSLATKRF